MDKSYRDIASALKKGSKLSDDQVVKLAELRRQHNVGKQHVRVQKLALRPGEELWDFIDAICTAVSTNRVLLADGSLDAWLQGIFDDHVIVQDFNTGRLFKADFVRNEKGEFEFGEPVEVRQEFVPVGGSGEDEVEKVRRPQYLEIAKSAIQRGRKWTFLPNTFKRR